MPEPTPRDASADGDDASETHEQGSTPGRSATLDDIRGIYADQADRMARFEWMNRLMSGRYRERLFGRAEGRVLDVACGTGLNARYLPADTEYVGVDLSPDMLANARERFATSERHVTLHEMDAQELGFDDDSFDTVISSLSTCTFPDPGTALAEMNRVCKPDGRVLLLEHGRSSVGPIAKFQDWRADAHFRKHACRWNQDPGELVRHSDLAVVEMQPSFLGIITTIEARSG